METMRLLSPQNMGEITPNKNTVSGYDRLKWLENQGFTACHCEVANRTMPLKGERPVCETPRHLYTPED